MTDKAATILVYRIVIKASAQAIWDAITKPEWTERYAYGGRAHYELKGGGHYHHEASPEMKSFGLPDKVILGEVLESDPPRKLVQTWHPQFTPEMIAEPPSRLTYEIVEGKGVCTVTITHDVTGAPMVAGMVPGGGDPAGAAAAGRGSSAISSRCWKPARACRPSPIAKAVETLRKRRSHRGPSATTIASDGDVGRSIDAAASRLVRIAPPGCA